LIKRQSWSRFASKVLVDANGSPVLGCELPKGARGTGFASFDKAY